MEIKPEEGRFYLLGYKAEEQKVIRGGNVKNDHVIILQPPGHSVPQ